MNGKIHSLASLLEETAIVTGQAFVVLTCENAGGAHRLGEAFPTFGVDDLDTLCEGPLIIAYRDDAQGRDGCNAVIALARQGYEETHSVVTSTVTFIGRANEGDSSRTGVLTLVAEVGACHGDDTLFRFTGAGHLMMPRAGVRLAA